MNDETSTALLRRIDEAWEPFWSRAEGLDAQELRSSPAGSDWSIGLILAHCARWEDWSYDAVANRVRDGSTPPTAGIETWSEQWALEDRDIAPEEARRWLGASHGRLRALLAELRPEQWDEVVVRSVDFCTFHHYDEHITSLPAAGASGT